MQIKGKNLLLVAIKHENHFLALEPSGMTLLFGDWLTFGQNHTVAILEVVLRSCRVPFGC
jgi:hypothetical protein